MKYSDFVLTRYDADDGKLFDWKEPRYEDVVDENGLGLSGNGDDVVGGCVFHAQLHPATAACHCGAYLVEYCYVGMWVGDEL